MTYIVTEYLATPEEITELDPMPGNDYMVRVVFSSGDRTWGQWLTTSAAELAPHLFPEVTT